MSTISTPEFAAQLSKLNVAQNAYASQFVSELLAAAYQRGASDVHLHPTAGGLEVRWRIDGVLQPVGTFPPGDSADIVSRLKVLAGLLTYRTDVPQEGRVGGQEISGVGFQPTLKSKIEMRVSTFPTLFGERAVVRIFAAEGRFLYPEELGLPDDVLSGLLQKLDETSGALLITGPAGQIAFPLAEELAQHNEVWGIARFSEPGSQERCEKVGVHTVVCDLAKALRLVAIDSLERFRRATV